MHELSVCQALITQLETLAQAQAANRILDVTLGIGPLSGIEPRLLEQAYPLAAAGTVAEHAQLTIQACPVRVHCSSCGAESDATVSRLVCAQCGDWHTRLISGDELLLLHVELSRETECV